MRKRPDSSGSDAQAAALFRELDLNGNGSLSYNELRTAIVNNPEFARLATSADRGPHKKISSLAAGHIAKNLQSVFDDEYGDGDGELDMDEFIMMMRQLSDRLSGETQDAVGALPAQPSKPAPPSSRSKFSVSGMFGGGGKHAAAGRAEAQLAAIQTVLRDEIVVGLEERLAQADALRGADIPPRASETAYREGLLVAIDACRQLLGEQRHGSGDEAAAELELLQLRRSLAETKVRLAEQSGARQVLQHELHQLQAEQGSRGKSLFAAVFDN